MCDRRSSVSGRGQGISNFRHYGTRRNQLDLLPFDLVDELDGTVVVLIVFHRKRDRTKKTWSMAPSLIALTVWAIEFVLVGHRGIFRSRQLCIPEDF